MARISNHEGPDPDFPVPDSVAELPLDATQSPVGRLLSALGCARRSGGSRRSSPRREAAEASRDRWREDVQEEEFLWMEARRPLAATFESLVVDYGRAEAAAMSSSFEQAGLVHLLPALAWPGVGTRWREFLAWCQAAEGSPPSTPAEAFRGFGRSLGRVVTYRALALDAAGLRKILREDCIFSSGRLRTSSEELERIVNSKGVQTVCVARLFISHLRRLLGHDPSISLHDDWQTTSLIASGYASGERRVHLFEVSCPKVESIGWTLQEVALRRGEVLEDDGADHEPWFLFPAPAVPRGVWFDGRWQRTERYGLYGVPFLSSRLKRLRVFESVQEVGEAVRPFAERQAELHARDVFER